MKQVSVMSRPRTDHASSSEAIDHGPCELDGRRNPPNLITVNTNQRQTFMRISCFNAQSLGKRKKEKTTKKQPDIEHFAMDEQLDVLFITETWLRCQRDEAKCIDRTPPGYSMRSFPRSTRDKWLSL